ncbi:MAG: FecR domain-containing protein, partial [Candidatus Aenigmatarchaeota archaeon]
MKRFYIFLVFGIFLIFLNSFSQTTIRIIDIKGEVLVKISPTQPWEKARVNMPLNKETEIQTKINSECTIGFDTDLRNVLTLKENSQVKVEEILPAKVFLSKGRVFSLIKDVASLKEFKVRTPVAIAGVKGTGFSMENTDSGSVIKCFEDEVDVTGLDNQGNPTQEAELLSGFGINVDLEGNLG